MILKNISEDELLITVNGQNVEIGAGVLFSVDCTTGTQLLNMYPNSLSQEVVLNFSSIPLELTIDEGDIVEEGSYDGQLGVLEGDLLVWLTDQWKVITTTERTGGGGR